MRYLLIVSFCLLNHLATAQAIKSRTLKLSNAVLFEKLTTSLEASRLLRLYRTDLNVSRVRQNRHEPGIKDSILTAATPADRLTLLKNRYNTLLVSATFTSDKVNFGSLKTGVSKAIFCRTLHLSPAYTVYTFTDGMENFVQLTCTFIDERLKSVDFKYLINPDTID